MHTRRVVLLALVLASTIAVSAQVPAAPAPVPAPIVITPPSSNTYPEIVRIRTLEGDVRVSRGKAIEKIAGSTWQQAAVDLPLETGYNLVTGDGRAEIEFEDASTAYLDADSALSIDDAHTTGGVPRTLMTLLAGSLTLHVKPTVAGSYYQLKTPTDSLSVSYPEKLYARIDSYVDAMAITPQKDESFSITGATGQKAAAGQTVFYTDGQLIPAPGALNPADYADWDAWVKTRLALRSAALASVTAASGLPTSTPGLADLNGQGVFFACGTYGTCWEPPAEITDDTAPAATSITSQGPEFSLFLTPATVTANAGDTVTAKLNAVGLLGFASPLNVTATLPSGVTCGTSCAGDFSPGTQLALQFKLAPGLTGGKYPITLTATSGPLTHTIVFTVYLYTYATDTLPFLPAIVPYFPCFPAGVRPGLLHDGTRGHDSTLNFHYGASTVGYGWAVCHTGTWIYRAHQYIWVVPKGTQHRRHHHPPVRWFKCGKQTCYAPLHPRDLKASLPVNHKHEIYALQDKEGHSIERKQLDPKDKVEVLNEAPKEFRKPNPLPLAKADEPHIEAHEMKFAFANKTDRAAESKTYLAFNPKSHNFLLASETVDGNRHKVVQQSFADRRSDLRVHNDHVEAGGKTRMGAGTGTHTGTTHTTGTHTATHTTTHTGGGHAGGGHSSGGGSHGGGHR